MRKFSSETNGYNRNEVNQFINDVIKEIEEILVRVKNQNKEISILKKEIEHYKNLENTLKQAITKAKETVSYLKNTAKEREAIITEAKLNADRIVNEALLKAEKIENKADILEKNLQIFKIGRASCRERV